MLIWIMAPHSTRRSGMLSSHNTTLSLVSTLSYANVFAVLAFMVYATLLSYFVVIVQAVFVEKSWLLIFLFFLLSELS